jgi:hypothetical protein
VLEAAASVVVTTAGSMRFPSPCLRAWKAGRNAQLLSGNSCTIAVCLRRKGLHIRFKGLYGLLDVR